MWTPAGGVSSLSGHGSEYRVTALALSDGTVNLYLVKHNRIVDTGDRSLGSTYPAGENHSYTVDTAAPFVASVERVAPANRTAWPPVFAVAFNEPVAGVDLADFALSANGTGAGNVTSLSGSGSLYNVTVVAGPGAYSLGLIRDHGIGDVAGNPLAGDDPFPVQSFVVTDTGVAPVLAGIPDQTARELSPLTFAAGVTNGYLLAAPLVYGLDGGPEGATMDPATGEFEWIPTEIQNGGHTLTVTVTDQNGRTGSQDVVIVVSEVNAAPVLAQIPDQMVNASSTLTFTANATDGDLHPGVGTEVVAKNLAIPWSIDWLPDGTALFTERGGSLRIIRDGMLAPDPLLSLDVSGGEGGLLGIAVDPNFGENHHIYLYYSTTGTDHAFINKVVRYQFANGTVTEDMVLIDGIPGARYHDGGRIQFGPDGYLYVTTGDASSPALAQDLGSLAGKILRIDRDGGIPADNPFADSPVWSTGHRNSQGIDWDEHGNMVATEHGPSGGRYGKAHDEINVIVPGANYGWPNILGGQSAEGMQTPILHTGRATWAPSGAEFYYGGMIPEWTGMYFVAALKGTHLHMVDLDIQNYSVVSHQRLFKDEFGRLRDVQTGPDGYLYLLTSNRDGRGEPVPDDDRIIRVVPVFDADGARPANTLTYGLEGEPEGASIDPASGAFIWDTADGRRSGTATFNVTVSDGRGGTDVQPVRVQVIGEPEAPQNLRATPAPNSVILAWDNPDDDSITGYRILSGSPAGQLPLSALVNNTNSTDAFYTVENLEPSTTYVFGVVAINEHGESGPSEPVSVSTAPPARTHFVTTWETTKAGESITIPVGGATGRYAVDWGDGTVSANVTGDQTYTYGAPGTHTVRIYGDFTRIYLDGQQPNADKLRSIEQWGDIRWESASSAFRGASNMAYNATDAPDLSAVGSMHRMFGDAYSFDGDLSAWNVSAVTNMTDMFSLAYSFDGDLSTWNVSAVTDMSGMFAGAFSFDRDISGWDVSGVTDMNRMFSGADLFDQDISAWNVSAVTDMSGMFDGAASFDGDISAWNVSAVTDMESMFAGADLFDQDISAWNVSAVTDMTDMFYDAFSFDQDISGWDVSGITEMSGMFDGADLFEQNLGPWYIVLDTDSPAVSADDRLAGNIRAQNDQLSGHSPAYNVTGEHAGLFEVAGGALRIKDGQNVTTTTYQVTVAATGDGLFGSGNRLVIPVAATEPAANTPPAAPQNLRFGATTNTTIALTWDDPDDATITGYKILSRTPATQTHLSVLVNNTGSAETAYTVRNLEPDTAYVFRVVAVNDHGESGYSNFIGLSTAPINAPPTVQAGADQAVAEGDTVTLTGTATDPDGDPLTYLWTHDSALDIQLANATSISTTFAAPEVSSNTTIIFTLTADDGTDTSSDTLALTVTDIPAASDASPPSSAFVTTWRTSTAGESITIPVGGAAGTYTVDWGDGTVSTDVAGDQTHTYDAAGTYTVSISGDFARILLSGNQTNSQKLQSIEQWGDINWESMHAAFYGASNMVYRATDTPDLSDVTDTSSMFVSADSFNGDLSDWDVSGVTDMSYMFGYATSFNGDLSDWDVSSVTDMYEMFRHAHSFNGDLSDWDTSSVTDMSDMFIQAYSFNGNISDWDTSSVTDMDDMFRGAASFNQPLDNWDVSSVTNMGRMFMFAASFNQPLDNWDVSSVTNMNRMFQNATYFNGNLSFWDTSSVTNMDNMFYGAASFNQPLDNWDVSSVTRMPYMFYGAASFNQPLNSWNVSAVTDMTSMFSTASSFNGDISDWDVSSVTDMSTMFIFATAFNSDISDWDVSSVTDMFGMFTKASSFNGDISDWDVSSVTHMSYMFDGASSFDQNLGNWYIVPDDTSIIYGDVPGIVGNISAQNQFLTGQDPSYGIGSGADSGHFEINGTSLVLNSIPDKATYTVNVTSTGGFGTDNSKMLAVTVEGYADAQLIVDAGPDQTTEEGQTVYLNGTAIGGTDRPTYLWTHDSALEIIFTNASSPATTFAAPQVDSATVIPLTLTVQSGTKTASDSMNVTVNDDAPHSEPFVTTWETTKADESIRIQVGGTTGRYTVDWGDGTVSANVRGAQMHTYDAPGTHTVRIYGDFTRIYLDEQQPTADKLRSIEQWGDIRWESMNSAFQGASNMVYRATDAPDLSGVTDTYRMFYGASSFDGDISSWDVSSVTNMYQMLHDAPSFNQDLSSWNVSAVTDMAHMFSRSTSFNGDISSWDVSSVTDTHGMFSQATSFNQDLSSWDVSSVTDTHSMFAFTTSFNQDISSWDVSAVTDMRNMFSHSTSFNQDLSSWDVSAVTDMRNMFDTATSFNQDLSSWNVSAVTDMNRMFDHAASFNGNISGVGRLGRDQHAPDVLRRNLLQPGHLGMGRLGRDQHGLYVLRRPLLQPGHLGMGRLGRNRHVSDVRWRRLLRPKPGAMVHRPGHRQSGRLRRRPGRRQHQGAETTSCQATTPSTASPASTPTSSRWPTAPSG